MLYIEASNSINTPIRIITTFELKNINKTNFENLYKTEGKYIYYYNPNNIKKVMFSLNRKYSKLRFLKEEYSDNSKIDICYNAANMVILEDNRDNCIPLEDTAYIEYSSEFNYETYLIIYSNAGEDSFTINKLEITKIEKPIPTDDQKKSNKTWIIVGCVVGGVLLIVVGIIIFIRMKHKRITSDTIESANK